MHAYFRGIDSWEYNEDECFLDIHKAYRITVGLVVESLISDPCVQVAMKAWEEKRRNTEGKRETCYCSTSKAQTVMARCPCCQNKRQPTTAQRRLRIASCERGIEWRKVGKIGKNVLDIQKIEWIHHYTSFGETTKLMVWTAGVRHCIWSTQRRVQRIA